MKWTVDVSEVQVKHLKLNVVSLFTKNKTTIKASCPPSNQEVHQYRVPSLRRVEGDQILAELYTQGHTKEHFLQNKTRRLIGALGQNVLRPNNDASSSSRSDVQSQTGPGSFR